MVKAVKSVVADGKALQQAWRSLIFEEPRPEVAYLAYLAPFHVGLTARVCVR